VADDESDFAPELLHAAEVIANLEYPQDAASYGGPIRELTAEPGETFSIVRRNAYVTLHLIETDEELPPGALVFLRAEKNILDCEGGFSLRRRRTQDRIDAALRKVKVLPPQKVQAQLSNLATSHDPTVARGGQSAGPSERVARRESPRGWWWWAAPVLLGLVGVWALILNAATPTPTVSDSSYAQWVSDGRPYDSACYLQNVLGYERHYGYPPSSEVDEGIRFACAK